MVAQVADIIAHGVERLDGGVGLLAQPLLFDLLVVNIVGQRGALDQVAVVDQQVVGVLFAGLADQHSGAGEAQRGIRLVLVVVVTQHVGVDIRGFDQPQGEITGGLRVVVVTAGQQKDNCHRAQFEGGFHCWILLLWVCQRGAFYRQQKNPIVSRLAIRANYPPVNRVMTLIFICFFGSLPSLLFRR